MASINPVQNPLSVAQNFRPVRIFLREAEGSSRNGDPRILQFFIENNEVSVDLLGKESYSAEGKYYTAEMRLVGKVERLSVQIKQNGNILTLDENRKVTIIKTFRPDQLKLHHNHNGEISLITIQL